MRQPIPWSDADVVNLDDYDPSPNARMRPWLIYDTVEVSVVAVVFAEHEQDAFDDAADAGRLDAWLIEEAGNTPGIKGLPASDYPTLGTAEESGIVRLGNASEPYDLDNLDIVQLRNPPMSFAAVYAAFVNRGYGAQ